MSDGLPSGKDASILAFLKDIDLKRRGWIVVDHWDADKCAIGIGRKSGSGKIAYVSTWRQPAGQFYVELESPDSDDPLGYVTEAVIEECGIEQAVDAIEEHRAEF